MADIKFVSNDRHVSNSRYFFFLLSSGVNARTYTTFHVFLSGGRGRWEELRCLRIPPAVQSRDISDSHLSSRSAAFPGR